MQEHATSFFPRLNPKSGVVIADGYGIRVHVERNHLVVADGIGKHRRERRFARAGSGLKRLVVLGHEGFVSLAALRWLIDVGASFLQIDRDGRVIASSATYGLRLAQLRRAQALAAFTDAGIAITRELLRQKVAGQLALVRELSPSQGVETEMRRALDAIQTAWNLDALRIAEASAANAYWSAWEAVPIRWARKDERSIPTHWRTFGKRGSLLTGAPRLASNPLNAVLNYCYALLEAEATLACRVVGLDPGLGLLHADLKSRDSLALDVMEAARPSVDSFVLQLIRARVFAKRDFHESPNGVTRVLAPLTHIMAESIPRWAAAVAAVAEGVATALAGAPGSRLERIPTKLTQTNRRGAHARGQRSLKASKHQPSLPRACEACGTILGQGTRRYCDACRPQRQAEVTAALVTSAHARLSELRAKGLDPSTTPEVKAKIGAKIADRGLEAVIWNVSHAQPDPRLWTGEILPKIRGVSLTKMAAATGLSKSYLSAVRAGLKVPHPRHWTVLRKLGG